MSALPTKEQAIIRRFRALRDSFARSYFSRPLQTRASSFAADTDIAIENDALTSEEQALLELISDDDFYKTVLQYRADKQNTSSLYNAVVSNLCSIFETRSRTSETVTSLLNDAHNRVQEERRRTDEVLRNLNLLPHPPK